MRIKLVVSPMNSSRTDYVEVEDGLSDEQIEEAVAEDLMYMRSEMVDSWWEKIDG